MIGIVVAASGYRKFPRATEEIIRKALTAPATNIIVVDGDAIMRNVNEDKADDAVSISFFRESLSNWVLGNEVNYRSIAQTADSIQGEHVFVLEAFHHKRAVVWQSLLTAREVWFGLSVWPKAFALVVDDPYVVTFAERLDEVFWIPAKCLSHTELSLRVLCLRTSAFVIRWSGRFALPVVVEYMYAGWRRWFKWF